MCRAATINETRALANPYRARNHAAAAGARNLILFDAQLSSRSPRYNALRDLTITPHIAVDGRVSKYGKRRTTRNDRRTTRHPAYAASRRLRKRIEEGLGWIKTTGGLAKTRHRGLDRVR